MAQIYNIEDVKMQKKAEAIQNVLTHLYTEMCQCGLVEAAHFVDCARQSLLDMMPSEALLDNAASS